MRLLFVTTLLACWLRPTSCFSVSGLDSRRQSTVLKAVQASEQSQLALLAGMTTLSIDSGDLKVIEEYAKTGYITDATTNPLFVSQAGLSGDPVYLELVDSAVDFAVAAGFPDEKDTVSLAIDRLAVNLGAAIAMIVPGYISTEVDPRLSFDTKASIERAERIIDMYDEIGVPRERVLIKLAATWEGILAAEELEKKGIQCNLTLIFSFVQAVACAQRGIHLISPFPGRVLDYYKTKQGRPAGVDPEDDEGVIAVKQMYDYYKVRGRFDLQSLYARCTFSNPCTAFALSVSWTRYNMHASQLETITRTRLRFG
jgi:transaldolase